MDVREDSPLNEWKDNSENQEENDYEWINESEGLKIRIEHIESADKEWKIALIDIEPNIEKVIKDEFTNDERYLRKVAEDFANTTT